MASWTVLHQELDEALLGVWGSSATDLWAVGADHGSGPVVLHGTADGWTRLVTGTVGDLWWVYGPTDDEIVMVGAHGTILRYERASNTVREIDSGTDATLFGVWGVPERMWAVGGHLPPHEGPPVVLQIEGETVTPIALPVGVPDDLLLFKVWGTGDDDVTVVGDGGALLHWDGAAWSWSPFEDSPRLVTVHGTDGGQRVVVGGANNAMVLEESEDGWSDASPPFAPALNGVFVHPIRSATVGMLGAVFFRESAAWFDAPALPLFVDLHAVWVDPAGDVYTVGGGLLSAAAMDRGALLRWGPERAEALAPSSDSIPEKIPNWEPGPTPDADGGAGLEDVEPAPDSGQVSDVGPVEDVPGEVVTDTDVAEETTDGADGADGDAPSTPDGTGQDAPQDTAPVPDTEVPVDAEPDGTVGPMDADAGTPSEGLLVVLGEVTPELEFTPIEPNQNLEIVQGPQGGVHVEVGVRVELSGGLEATMGDLEASAWINGELVGDMILDDYGLYETPQGYVSWPLPVIFFTNLADPYVGSTLHLSITVILDDGSQGTGTADVTLVDWY